MLLIERLQVEGGFLDSLSVQFTRGLNVVIGPRGVGKTSVIELIRFCFGVDPITPSAALDARQHALSILGPDGRVTVTANLNGERMSVARSADERESQFLPPEGPIVLSQGEVEAIGIDAAGRLWILDDFRRSAGRDEDDLIIAQVRSLTIQLQQLSAEISGIAEQLQAIAGVAAELKSAEAAQAELTRNLEKAESEQKRLLELADQQAALSVRLTVLDRVSAGLSAWSTEVGLTSQRVPMIEDWPSVAGAEDPLITVRSRVDRAGKSLEEAQSEVRAALEEIQALRQSTQGVELALAEEARELRRRLDEMQEGAGSASRRVAQLRERVGQEAALKALLRQKQDQMAVVQERRVQLLDELDASRETRHTDREAIAAMLRKELGPRIDVQVLQDAATADYSTAIASALRGSGLHYSTLAPVLADRLSPRELAEAVEQGDWQGIASITKISDDRAARLVEHIRSAGTADILTAAVDDSVELSLLDGKEYKPTEALSTGQRCTVILPILLTHHERLLIVDEPEAHLDNAFIVSTLIQALGSRSSESQLILATHNANIPVLGNADQVIFLGSDGKRGFLRHGGELEDPVIVEAITSVMEGGRDAFRRRADFYEHHPSPS